jgi:NCAIR mutase (PurE)-related protein
VRDRTITPEEALPDLSYEDLGFAKVDHHRRLRRGFAEVVFCQGKRPEQVVEIVERLGRSSPNVIATRASPELAEHVTKKLPEVRYDPVARILHLWRDRRIRHRALISVVSAGTSDQAVAAEAALTARLMGHRVDDVHDVGVAGIHRLAGSLPRLREARVLIVVAGMEGALPSVVAGLLCAPVIAVPTSVGYGASFGGLAALLGMLNSCAAGVTVVNIDNGFGAAYAAHLIIASSTPRDRGHRKG